MDINNGENQEQPGTFKYVLTHNHENLTGTLTFTASQLASVDDLLEPGPFLKQVNPYIWMRSWEKLEEDPGEGKAVTGPDVALC